MLRNLWKTPDKFGCLKNIQQRLCFISAFAQKANKAYK